MSHDRVEELVRPPSPRLARAEASTTAGDYDPDGVVNLSGYAGSLTAYTALAAAAMAVARRRGVLDRPVSASALDVVLGGLATHKFARLLAKGSVTSPLRAPFTRFERPIGSAEHQERARHRHGFRHTVGELLTCPYCLAVWIGTAYAAGLDTAPGAARSWARTFSVVAIADFLTQAYERVRAD